MTEVVLEAERARPSYVARAFALQYNVILLGGALLFALALASTVPLVAAAAAEFLWLAVGSNSGAVRRWLDSRDAVDAGDALDETAPGTLPPPFDRVYQHRINLLDRALTELHALGGARSDPTFKRSLPQLVTLRGTFVATCEAHQSLQRFLTATPEGELAGEVERLQRMLAAETDLTAKMGLRQGIVLAKRRVEQRQTMMSELTAHAVRLETVERAVAHLIRQGRALGPTANLGTEIEAIVAEVRKGNAPRS